MSMLRNAFRSYGSAGGWSAASSERSRRSCSLVKKTANRSLSQAGHQGAQAVVDDAGDGEHAGA